MTGVREDLAVEELAALVCSTLERHGVRVVLSGGSVVSIYSDNVYQSYDLDFIQTGLAARPMLPWKSLASLSKDATGFIRARRS